MTKRTTLVRLCAAILVVAALAVLSVPAMAADAASILEQMTQNSAAWHIANNAGDVETCNRLHAENERLSALLAQGGGTAAYSENGTWTITDASGNVTSSASAGLSGKDSGVVYTTAGADGSISAERDRAYTDSSIDAYMNNGGTHSGLSESYNNAAQHVADTNNYEDFNAAAAQQEIAVAKELLNLTDAQAAALNAGITAQKAAYAAASTQYDIAAASGNTSAAAAAKTAMEAAHAAAQAIRAQYNYTGDTDGLTDGGSYFGGLPGTTPTTPSVPATPPVQQFTITASAGNGGSISPSGTLYLVAGSSRSYSITPAAGYDISDVKVDGKSIGAVSTYTFSAVTASHTISASFVEKAYTITASAGAGGSISPSGSKSVAYGGCQKYTVTPNTGYEIADVKVDGKSIGKVTSYTFSNVTSAHTITASFVLKTYDITASAGAGGSISPSGSKSVAYGGSQKYTVTPNTGYDIADVKVDGKSVGKVTSYTFSNVTSAHTITASFVLKTYDITASAGRGGTISPSGVKAVAYGDDQGYIITPNAGYAVADVKVDGRSVGAVRTYVFSNVTAGHSISASFRPDPVVDMGTLSVTDTLGASLSGKSIKSGYGVCVSVPVTLENVTDVSVTLSYNFGSGRKSVTLRESGSKFVLPVNPDSPTGARCVYIPVETKDGSYTLTATVTALDADGNTVTDSATGTVTVLGSMYEDDFTGDS